MSPGEKAHDPATCPLPVCLEVATPHPHVIPPWGGVFLRFVLGTIASGIDRSPLDIGSCPGDLAQPWPCAGLRANRGRGHGTLGSFRDLAPAMEKTTWN